LTFGSPEQFYKLVRHISEEKTSEIIAPMPSAVRDYFTSYTELATLYEGFLAQQETHK
jgi:hypothetical protein